MSSLDRKYLLVVGVLMISITKQKNSILFIVSMTFQFIKNTFLYMFSRVSYIFKD